MMNIIGTSLSGLLVSQRSLETASNNISNVNAEGYSRQRVEQKTRVGGSGVEVGVVTRSYDQFVTNQVRSSTSAFGEVDLYHNLASQIDNMLADESTGLAPAMKSFFNSVNDVANDPTSLPARQVMLSEADSTTHLLNTTTGRFDEIRQQVNSNLDNMVNDLNTYAANVASLNVRIVASINAQPGRQMPNDLLDQRDLLLNKIAGISDVSVVPQQDGSVSVFIGSGQPLVLGKYSSTLTVQNSKFDPLHRDIFLDNQNISSQITGGSLAGNLRFRDEVLDPAQQQLGLVATGLAIEFNNLHQTGFDLDGNPGNPTFFDLTTPSGFPAVQVNGTAKDPTLQLSANFVMPISAANLGSAYRFDVLAGGLYSLTNLDDNTVAVSGALPPATSAFGFDLVVGAGALNPGDSFRISPTANVGQSIHVNAAIGGPRQVAAAGSSGVPGDNAVALKLADLEKQPLMQNGKATINQVYGNLVADVGIKTHSALVSRSAQDVLLKQATTSKENVSGVNLDEEAADLIKFQQSYQAAAQSISMAKTLFDTLIGAVR